MCKHVSIESVESLQTTSKSLHLARTKGPFRKQQRAMSSTCLGSFHESTRSKQGWNAVAFESRGKNAIEVVPFALVIHATPECLHEVQGPRSSMVVSFSRGARVALQANMCCPVEILHTSWIF